MEWALVCINPMSLSYWVYDSGLGQYVWTTAIVPGNTIINIVIYDGISPYSPPDNTQLIQVAIGKQIGELAS